ncbi:hypothetical protein KAH27_10380 [bacterium]|nr:hypothetical protein [bacterium]
MSPLLPILSFILLSLLVLSYETGLRYAILIAAIISGLILVIMTELLSLFHIVTFGGLLTSWLIVISITIILLIRRGYLWCVANADALFEDEIHEQDIHMAFNALAHFNIFIFVMSLPSFVLLFQNFFDHVRGKELIDEEEEQL